MEGRGWTTEGGREVTREGGGRKGREGKEARGGQMERWTEEGKRGRWMDGER